jgi:hypothetical protein
MSCTAVEPPGAALWLVVVAGAGADHEFGLADQYFEIMILIAMTGTWRIEGERVVSMRILNAGVDLRRQIVIRTQNASAAPLSPPCKPCYSRSHVHAICGKP